MLDVDASTPYTDSIRENRGGSILYLDPHTEDSLGPPDAYTHLLCKLSLDSVDAGGFSNIRSNLTQLRTNQFSLHNRPRGLDAGNTGNLCPTGEHTLQYLKEGQADAIRRLFFFGPGAGVEVADARAILSSANISAMSLSPRSPSLELNQTFSSMSSSLWEEVKRKGNTDEQTKFSWIKTAKSMNVDFAAKMDRELGTGVFSPTGEQTNTQYIGTMEQLAERTGEIGPQDWIYERHGPLTKQLCNPGNEHAGRIAQLTLRTLLDERSILVIPSAHNFVRVALKELLPECVEIAKIGIWIHRDGPHRAALADALGVSAVS